MNKFYTFGLTIAASLTLTLGACTGINTPFKSVIAERIASPAWMVKRPITAAPFVLTAYERMHKRHAAANIYIEGDGAAWLSRTKLSSDPTPSNPVALHLAAYDKADNVAYIARPCQFTGMLDADVPCDSKYWSTARFSATVIESYQLALDDIKKRYDIKKFNLIGFSGGGAVAAILAAERNDVASLRTVAGNLDHRTHSAHHGVSYLEASLNPPDYAANLAKIPQYHFIGGQDDIIPPSVLNSYIQALGSSSCVSYQLIQEAAHEEGWVDKWPDLLKKQPACRSIEREFEPLDLPPEPFYTPHMGDSKK